MKEFRVCPACGYRHGFHVFFKETAAGVALGLICPNCGQSYDLGWQTSDIPLPLSVVEKEKYESREDDQRL